ncbi:Tat pathway signal protein [Streptacidiphilus sp. MAP5-52]|uniref:Tat pathway signal protein n=1 Tax=Streptacidiphilus sp. MAP5-52 TaxID=3156267 RepID=UPI003515A493
MPTARRRNDTLAALLTEAGWSHADAALAHNRVASENAAPTISRSHIAQWVAGSVPHDPRTRRALTEAFARRLHRPLAEADLGLPGRAAEPSTGPAIDWDADTLITLADLGSQDVSIQRRHLLGAAVYQAAALTAPPAAWWSAMAARSAARQGSGRRIGTGDLAAVQDMISLFSQLDQRRGGGHGRAAISAYLHREVAPQLHGRYADDQLRRGMLSAAAELTYLAGWMAFDAGDHAPAQQYLSSAVKLAAEADDPALAGHVLRALAHQANDLGHHQQALDLAAASTDGDRYRAACPRERSLLQVVHARTLASTGDTKAAARALLAAETELGNAAPGDAEPRRVWFYSQASLAHETACALRDSGDTDAAIRQFQLSARIRRASTFTRTHAVTLGYLGDLQARQGGIELACTTWTRALDAMEGVHSARARQTVHQMRSALSPYRGRGIALVAEVDARAAQYLSATA